MLINRMSERETVVELPWAAGCCPCVEKLRSERGERERERAREVGSKPRHLIPLHTITRITHLDRRQRGGPSAQQREPRLRL
jgi:hypothetical protein